MKHLGDITKINGYEIPIVDCICGGSPCQDLSVAGKRAGLAGERSGLFMEQMRIVREMRENDRRKNNRKSNESIRPRFLVWENVPGALSSGNPAGEDFRIVLEEVARVADSNAVIPGPPDRWTNAGVIVGNGWSVAWRIHDSQFWGVAQRRRRLSLVADFGSESVAEILFERKGMSRDIEKSERERKGITGDSKSSVETSYTLKIRGGVERDSKGKKAGKGPLVQEEKSGTLGVSQDQTVITYHYSSKDVNKTDVAPTLDLWAHSPTCNQGGVVAVYGETSFSGYSDKNIATLRAQGGHNMPYVLESNQNHATITNNGISTTLPASMGEGGGYVPIVTEEKDMVVRRLTPLECERLQGFPDGWTDIGSWTDTKGKVHKESSDTARYKALGNSIAVGYANEQKGFWIWLMKRISERYDRVATLGSLFDGIGGFPLAWEYCNGKGTAIWASEIEEFPIAVTKYHFPEGSEIDV